jgi:CubicO group peptidase (beta-lactamase class C family)
MRRHPVFPPFATPSYTNAAFAILALVIETVTRKGYDALLDDGVLKPLGMARTSVRKPDAREGNHVIVDDEIWRRDLGAENPYVYPSPRPISYPCSSFPLPNT